MIDSVGQEGRHQKNVRSRLMSDDVDEVSFSLVMSVHDWIGFDSFARRNHTNRIVKERMAQKGRSDSVDLKANP